MNSKTDTLSKIRSQSVPPVEHPLHDGPWIQFADPIQQFAQTLAAVGGEALFAANMDAARQAIQQMACLKEASQIVSPLEHLSVLQTFDEQQVDDPHALDVVDVAILPGEFAVAENGAIWVDGRTVRHRTVYFLTQHLILVLPRTELVHNLHEAYQRLNLTEQGYGLFISGPSKTADIEQSLVIGAHGPRSMTALLVG